MTVQLPPEPERPNTRAFELFEDGAWRTAFFLLRTDPRTCRMPAVRIGARLTATLEESGQDTRVSRARDALIEKAAPMLITRVKQAVMRRYRRDNRRWLRAAKWRYFKDRMAIRKDYLTERLRMRWQARKRAWL